LQKVEELTLYTIEQNKEIQQQKKENEALKEKLAEQDAKYEMLLKAINELKN
jgi:hypothetical protein